MLDRGKIGHWKRAYKSTVAGESNSTLSKDCSIQCSLYSGFSIASLFLQLAAVTEDNKFNVLLSYSDLPIFQATMTALDMGTTAYTEVKTFYRRAILLMTPTWNV